MRVGTRKLSVKALRLNADHPHACGDKPTAPPKAVLNVGSSPCVWGQGDTPEKVAKQNRIIPMRVGTR